MVDITVTVSRTLGLLHAAPEPPLLAVKKIIACANYFTRAAKRGNSANL